MSRIRRDRFRKRRRFQEDDVSPMEGAINIVDAMLVFACGLMLSLVIFWNVDLRTDDMVPVSQGTDELTADEIESQDGETATNDSNFEEVGKVYRDPVTGNLYLAESSGDQTTKSAIDE
jgi:hypothetical protein